MMKGTRLLKKELFSLYNTKRFFHVSRLSRIIQNAHTDDSNIDYDVIVIGGGHAGNTLKVIRLCFIKIIKNCILFRLRSGSRCFQNECQNIAFNAKN